MLLGSCAAAIAVAAVVAWMAAEGPSPGSSASTLGVPVFLGGFSLAMGAIRLREAMGNNQGEDQLRKLELAYQNLMFGLIVAGVTFVVVLVLHALAAWRARQHNARVTHISGLLTAGLVVLVLGRHLWSVVPLAVRWDGPETLAGEEQALQALLTLLTATVGVPLCAVMALASLVLGVVVRRFSSSPN